MHIETETVNGTLIAYAAGRIEGANAAEFERAVRSAVDSHEGPVIIDCQRFDYISSRGLRVILVIARRVGQRNAPFAVCSLSPRVLEVFRVAGFDRVINTLASREEALSAVAG